MRTSHFRLPGESTRQRIRLVHRPFQHGGLVIGMLACGLLAGCGTAPSAPQANETPAAKQERLVNEAFAVQDQATKLLLGIKDQQSAEAAYNGLDQLKSQVVKLVDEIRKTGELTPEIKAKITAEISRRKSELQQQVSEFTSRLLTNPQLLQSLQPVLSKVNEFRQVLDGFLK
jgi:hypothetical protein